MSLPATDNFNRADTYPAGNLGANWTEVEAAHHSILANHARADATAFVSWNADAFSNDHSSEATVVVLGTSANVGTNIGGSAGAENAYQWGGGGSGELYKWVAGAFTLLLSSGTFVVNDTLKLEHQGTTLRCKINGTQTGGDVSDAAVSGGAPGLITNSSEYDNWTGDNIGAVVTGRPFFTTLLSSPRRAA